MVSDSSKAATDMHRRYLELKQRGDDCAARLDYAGSRHFYLSAQAILPQEVDAYLGLGAAAIAFDDWHAARSAFEQARQADSSCCEAYVGLAIVHQQAQDFPRAFDNYLKCLELNSDNLTALLGLFQTSCQMGTFFKIIRFLEIFLAKHPDDAAVLFCLATLQARDGQFAQARQSILRVLRLEPGKSEAIRLLTQIEQCGQVSLQTVLSN